MGRANRRWNANYAVQASGSIWTLFDAEGRAYRRSGYDIVAGSNGNGVVQEIQLTFQPDPSLGPPARLVETGRRTVLAPVSWGNLPPREAPRRAAATAGQAVAEPAICAARRTDAFP